MYAERKGWLLVEPITVRLEQASIHARTNCEECETNSSGRIERIELKLELEGPLLEVHQRERLSEIAEKCPVKRTR